MIRLGGKCSLKTSDSRLKPLLREDQAEWGLAKAGQVMVANVTVGRDKSVSIDEARFNPIKEYDLNPAVVNMGDLKDEIARSNKFTVKGIMLGSGGSILLELPNKSVYMITVHRDQKAPRYPGTLDSLAGITDTKMPVDSCIKEMVEEVVIIKNGAAIVPRYMQEPWVRYNSAVERTITDVSKNFGINEIIRTNATLMRVQDALYFGSDSRLQISIGFHAVKGDPISIVHIVVPPIVIREESLANLTFRETIAVETEGKVQERDVILVKIMGESASANEPEVMVYSKGRLLEKYKTFYDFMNAAKGMPTPPYSPILATTMKFIGLDDGYLRTYYHPTGSELFTRS